jgi:septal ring factor EnvC (AmiA/AmiB activator)
LSRRILDGFEQEGVGPTRNKTLCEYLKTMQFTIFQSVCDKVSSETAKEMSQAQKKKATLEEKQREYDHRLRNLDARLDRFHEDEKEFGDELKNLEKKNRLMEDQWQETKSQVEELK